MKAIPKILSLLTALRTTTVCAKNLPLPREEGDLVLPACLATTRQECQYDHLSATLLCQSFSIDFQDSTNAGIVSKLPAELCGTNDDSVAIGLIEADPSIQRSSSMMDGLSLVATIEEAAAAQTSSVFFVALNDASSSDDGTNYIVIDDQDGRVIAKLAILQGIYNSSTEDKISIAVKKPTRELSEEQVPLGEQHNPLPQDVKIIGKQQESDSGTSVVVYLLIAFLGITIAAAAVIFFVVVKKRLAQKAGYGYDQEQPPSKLRTVDGQPYDQDDIFVCGRAEPMPDIRIPIPDESQTYTTDGTHQNRTSMIDTDINTQTKVRCVSRMHHGRVDSATPALISMMQDSNEGENSLNIDTDALEEQDCRTVDFSNDFNFTSRLQKDENLFLQTFKSEIELDCEEYQNDATSPGVTASSTDPNTEAITMLKTSGLDPSTIDNLIQVYESQTKIELKQSVGHLACAICKFNLKADQAELVMKLEGCNVMKEHFAHVVCFAKDLDTASMKKTELGASKNQKSELGATNPLDRAIESDEDIY